MKQLGIYEHIHTSVSVNSLHKRLLLMVMLHFYKHEKFVKIHPDADHKSLTSSWVVLLALRRKQFRLHLSFFCKLLEQFLASWGQSLLARNILANSERSIQTSKVWFLLRSGCSSFLLMWYSAFSLCLFLLLEAVKQRLLRVGLCKWCASYCVTAVHYLNQWPVLQDPLLLPLCSVGAKQSTHRNFLGEVRFW